MLRWISGEVQFVCSPDLLTEFTSVGARPRFRQWFSEIELMQVASMLTQAAEWHPDNSIDAPEPSDPKDTYLVALAMHAHADCLVTGDIALQAHSSPIRIVTTRQLLQVLDSLDALPTPHSD